MIEMPTMARPSNCRPRPERLYRVAACGFRTNAAIVGINAQIASSFQTVIRAGDTGFVISIDRSWATIGPILVGVLFQPRLGLSALAAIMASGSLIATLMLLTLPHPPSSADRTAER